MILNPQVILMMMTVMMTVMTVVIKAVVNVMMMMMRTISLDVISLNSYLIDSLEDTFNRASFAVTMKVRRG